MAKGYQNTEILAYARDLALRDYDIVVSSEVGTGGKIIYTARTPELGKCKAQGHSVIEAVKNLIDARIDYIYALLVYSAEKGVPSPNAEKTGETTYVQESAVVFYTRNASSSAIELTDLPVIPIASYPILDGTNNTPSADEEKWRRIIGNPPMYGCVLIPVSIKEDVLKSASPSSVSATFKRIYDQYRKSVLALVNLDESEYSLSSHAQTVANCYAGYEPWNEPIEGYTVSVAFADSIKYIRIHKGEEVVYAGVAQ